MNISQHLAFEGNWQKDNPQTDFWSYCKFNNLLQVGKQRHDWAVFWFDKNVGFFYVEQYGEIPIDIIPCIEKYLEKSKTNQHLDVL